MSVEHLTLIPQHHVSLNLFCGAFFVGLQFNKDTVCTALRGAGIQPPEWVKIAKHLQVSIKLQVSVDDFLQGWCAYASGFQPSSMKLAEALENTGIPKCKEAAEQIRMKQGIIRRIRSIGKMQWNKIVCCFLVKMVPFL